MATYKESMRASDAYRKDSTPKSINHDKPGKDRKVSTASMASKDKQC